jgi:hypothetical protein
MRILLILFIILLNTLMLADSLSQEMPLVYEDENTGVDCPIPYLPSFSELPEIQALPDPFKWSDGRGRMSNFSDWQYRRVEIKSEIEHYEIGEKPVRPDSIDASYANGTLTVHVTVNGQTLTLTSAVILPDGDGPFPAMITITPILPADTLTNRGIAIIPYNFGQVMAWQQVRGSEPINKLYPDLIYMGAYSAWAWGVSRLIDGLELVQADLPIDLKHLGVTGCSFAGKMALFAGAFDERIALTIAQESGGGGYTTWRYSEVITDNVETLGNTSHVWFIEDLFQFSNDVPKLPFDHHELMAMVAPRALFVTGNPGWVWLADESGYVGSKAVQTVYEALGVPDRFGYSQIGGHDHCEVPAAQIPEIEAFVDKFMLGKDTVNTEVATTPYNTNLTPWINWDTPTLSNDSSYFGKSSLIYPPNLQKDVDTSITFTWNKVEDADKYYFQLSTNGTFTNIVSSDSTTDTVKTVTGLSEGKRYYWRVQVRNSAGSSGPWSDQWNFVTTIPLPTKPQLVSAAPYPNRTDYFTFTWKKVEYADKYRIQISRLLSFSPLAIPTATTTDTVINLQKLTEGQKYYWRVQAENIGGSGPWSDLSNFTIIFAPTDLELQKSGLNEITLTWEDHSNVEDGYVIERKPSQDTSFTVLDTLKGSGNEYVDEIAEVQNYTYRVKAYKDSAESDYSNEATIILTDIQEEKEIPTEYSISQNYPNPFNPSTTITFDLPRTDEVILKVFNILGEEVATLVSDRLNAGSYSYDWDASQMASGVYLYRLEAGEYIETRKMILMR